MIVSVAPSPSLDRTLVVDDVIRGRIHRPHTAVSVPGGKGFNVARAAHTLGAQVIGVAVLGGPTGGVVRQMLDDAGVPVSCVQGIHETRTCTSVASGTTGTMTEFYERATEVSVLEWAELEHRVAIAIDAGPDWLTISGSMPPGAPADALARLILLAHARGVRVAVDTHGEALAAALDLQPEVVKINVHEAAAVLGTATLDGRAAAEALHDRRAFGRLTVVTAGTEGAWAVSDDMSVRVPASHTGPFPVGSGDSFLAGLIVGLIEDPSNVRTALHLAAATAAANAQQPGAAVLDSEQARTWARTLA